MEKPFPDIVANSMGFAVAPEHYRPYPAYKDSGIEWLGDIPAHWDVKRLKEFAIVQVSNVDKKISADEDAVQLCNYVDVYYNHKIERVIEFMPATASPDQIRRFSLRMGDVLITKDSETWTDIAVPAVAIEDLPGVLCGYHLAHIRPQEQHDGFFLAHCIAAVGPRDQYHIAANGITRFGLTGDAIRNGIFAMPPLAEQLCIATFLDGETEKIDTLITKKERLIELLQEKRTALITCAVTKGLDPDAPMKDSGVEWSGGLPMHWKVCALKRIGELQAGAGFPDAEQGDKTQELPFFKVGDMSQSRNAREMIQCEHTVSRATSHRLRAFVFPPDTTVFAKVGAALMLNRRRMLMRPSCIDNNMMGFVPRMCDPVWAMHWLSGLDMRALANPGAVPSVNERQMQNVSALVPPVAEQRAIASHLDRETEKIDIVVARVRDAMDRLRELRAALISAAVTGKIDVRKAVP